MSNPEGPSAGWRAAVIGAGAMGAGIAALLADAGAAVALLDVAAPQEPRDGRARTAVAQQLAAGLSPEAASRIVTGTIEDDLELVADVDWIVEAVVENLELKRGLFGRLEQIRRPDAVVSSNTSTLRRADLVAGLGTAFDQHFLITHFFNPPRQMRLLEIVGASAGERSAAPDRIERYAAERLGKTLVRCRDTPGFIANRIGCFWLAMATLEALEAGLDLETADALLSTALRLPKTGAFGLFDLVGIDLAPHAWGGLNRELPASDAIQRYNLAGSAVFNDLLARGQYGRKTGAGFYRLTPERRREVWDPAAQRFRSERPADPQLLAQAQDLRGFCEGESRESRYLRKVMVETAAYVWRVADEIAETPADIDTAMRLGYGWTEGPFEIIARAGPEAVAAWRDAEAPRAVRVETVSHGGGHG